MRVGRGGRSGTRVGGLGMRVGIGEQGGLKGRVDRL